VQPRLGLWGRGVGRVFSFPGCVPARRDEPFALLWSPGWGTGRTDFKSVLLSACGLVEVGGGRVGDGLLIVGTEYGSTEYGFVGTEASKVGARRSGL
jgi:hypothetical protein